MTDHDDSGRSNSGEDRIALRGFEGGDEQLFDWAIAFIGGSLLDRLSLFEIVPIVRESVGDYMRFQTDVREPRLFLVRQILARAKRHMQLRGIDPGSVSEARAPRFLDLIERQEAMETLTVNDRKALRMLFLQKRSLEEIAAELDVSVVIAERQARRAVAKLRKWWAAQDAQT